MHSKTFTWKHDVTSYYAILGTVESKNSIFFISLYPWSRQVSGSKHYRSRSWKQSSLNIKQQIRTILRQEPKEGTMCTENLEWHWRLNLFRFTVPRCWVERTLFETFHLRRLPRVLINNNILPTVWEYEQKLKEPIGQSPSPFFISVIK